MLDEHTVVANGSSTTRFPWRYVDARQQMAFGAKAIAQFSKNGLSALFA